MRPETWVKAFFMENAIVFSEENIPWNMLDIMQLYKYIFHLDVFFRIINVVFWARNMIKW